MVTASKGDKGPVCRVMDALTVLAVMLGLGMLIMFGMSFLGSADAGRQTGTAHSATLQDLPERSPADSSLSEKSHVRSKNLTVSGTGTELR